MSPESLELVRYGFYALTVITGAVLLWRFLGPGSRGEGDPNPTRSDPVATSTSGELAKGKRIGRQPNPVIEVAPEVSDTASSPAKRARANGARKKSATAAVWDSASGVAMAEVLAGIRLPVHWEPDSPEPIGNPVRLTSTTDTPAEMATALANELARLGFTVIGTGDRSALATRGSDCLDIEVISDGSAVTTHMELRAALTDVHSG